MNYDDWNLAIAETFYNRKQAQKPVYLYVDDECLREIALQRDLDPESARDLFVQAVSERSYCIGQNRSQPFFKIMRWRTWERGLRQCPTAPPPFIAFLGFCVLAAADMTSDNARNVTSGNYYLRLNELLGRSGRTQPPGFDEIERAWERLNHWLAVDLQGRFGLPTANNELYGRHVGYPISQALMRRTDIEELPDFFRWCGLERGEENVDVSYFRQQLQIWASRTICSFSTQLKLVFANNHQQHIEAIADMALAHYRNWDGSKLTRKDGLRTASIVVQLNQSGRSFELFLHPQAPRDFPAGRYGSETLSRVADTEWFEPLDESMVAHWLQGRVIELQQNRYRFLLQPSLVVPLRSGASDLGGWLACSRVALGERHLVLCHQSRQQQVEDYLNEYGEANWRVIPGRDPIYADWVCFANVRITKFASLAQSDLDSLVPARQIGIRLAGGLPLKRGVWLKGGEPEAVIATDIPLPVFLDEVEVATAASGSTIINLQNYDLSEGNHVLRIGDRKTAFAISYSGNNLLGIYQMQQWGHPFQRIADMTYKPLSLTASEVPVPETIPSGQLYIAGTHIVHSPADPPPPRQHLLILPYGARKYIILGRHIGELFKPELPTLLPAWQAESYLCGYKQQVPFEPQWLVTISHRNNVTLRPLGDPKPALPKIASHDDKAEWLKWAGKRGLYRRLSGKQTTWKDSWLQYSQIAESSK